MPESELEGMSIEDYFPERFFTSNLWYCFHNMLAFKRYHSAIECKRYFRRFVHFAPECDYLHGILHTDLNEYDAIIHPIEVWLKEKGVKFATGTSVTEIVMDDANNTVVALKTSADTIDKILEVAPQDMVFFTNGSMSQNSCFGDNTTVAKQIGTPKIAACSPSGKNLPNGTKNSVGPKCLRAILTRQNG